MVWEEVDLNSLGESLLKKTNVCGLIEEIALDRAV